MVIEHSKGPLVFHCNAAESFEVCFSGDIVGIFRSKCSSVTGFDLEREIVVRQIHEMNEWKGGSHLKTFAIQLGVCGCTCNRIFRSVIVLETL